MTAPVDAYQPDVVAKKLVRIHDIANIAADADPGTKCGRQGDFDNGRTLPGGVNVVLRGPTNPAESPYFASDGIGIEQPTRRRGP